MHIYIRVCQQEVMILQNVGPAYLTASANINFRAFVCVYTGHVTSMLSILQRAVNKVHVP